MLAQQGDRSLAEALAPLLLQSIIAWLYSMHCCPTMPLPPLCWQAWLDKPQQEGYPDVLPSAQELAEIVSAGLAQQLADHASQLLEAALRRKHLPVFWSAIHSLRWEQPVAASECLSSALQDLSAVVDAQCDQLDRLSIAVLTALALHPPCVKPAAKTFANFSFPAVSRAQTPPYLAAIPLGSEAMHPMAGMASAFLPQASQFTHATTPTELPPTGPNSSTPLPPTGLLPQHSGRGQGGVIPLTALLQHPIASLQQPCTLEAGPPYSQVSTCWSLGLSSLAKWYRSHVSALLLLTATCSISGTLTSYLAAQLLGLDQPQSSEPSPASSPAPQGTFQPPGSLTQQRTDTAQVPGLPWAGGSLDELQNGCGVCTPSFASRTQQPHASATPQPKGHTAQPEAGSSNDSGLGSHALGVVSVCAHLWQLGLWPCCEEAATTVLSEAMHRHCAELVERAGFSEQVLPVALDFVSRVPLQLVQQMLQSKHAAQAKQSPQSGKSRADGRAGQKQPSHHSSHAAEQLADELQTWQLRLVHMCHEAVGELRLKSMFEVVVEYPDSQPAVVDMSECLRSTSLHSRFTVDFRATMSKRLLHAGAPARDIVHQFVSVMRVLYDMDPSGTLLAAIAPPIRAYLRGRPDTARCVVQLVTKGDSEGQPSLLDEAQENASTAEGLGAPGNEGDEAVLRVLASTGDSEGVSRPGAKAQPSGPDIVSMLAHVFGTGELFVAEYRNTLAVELLRAVDWVANAALRTVELLKLRFGETPMHACEVMLKDLADSKRLSHSCHAPSLGQRSLPYPPAWLTATVMSYLFWPPIGGWGDEAAEKGAGSRPQPQDQLANLKLPKQVLSAMDAYAAQFSALKAPRRLQWKPHLGQVTLQVVIGGVVVDCHVTPTTATILIVYIDHMALSLAELGAMVGIPPLLVKKHTLFWLRIGVMVEEGHEAGGQGEGSLVVKYRRASQLDPALHGTTVSDAAFVDEDAPAMPSATDAVLEELSVFEPYIKGMLQNYQGLPLERLQHMLKMFMVSPRYDKSIDQLATFLTALVAAGTLVLVTGVYKLQGK